MRLTRRRFVAGAGAAGLGVLVGFLSPRPLSAPDRLVPFREGYATWVTWRGRTLSWNPVLQKATLIGSPLSLRSWQA